MTQAIADLTVSVERPFDASGDALFAALGDPAHLGGVERVAREDPEPPDRRDAFVPDDPPRVRPGETYVGDLDVPVRGVDGSTYETYFTVEHAAEQRLVLVGGGDAPWGSFDARVVVAVADVPSGSVVRVDAMVDVAGDVAAVGAQRVRDGVTEVLEHYLSAVECGLARSA